MAKTTTSFRLSDKTKEYLDVLLPLFKETQTEIIERAVKLLYENREQSIKEDMNQRLQQANISKE